MPDESGCGEIRDAVMAGVCTPQTLKRTFVVVDKWIDGDGVGSPQGRWLSLRDTDPGVQTSISKSEVGGHAAKKEQAR